tara:strand:- start:378 stop:662 length:285 start_codon:yes stop_codon:yes gene_type:complete
MASSVPQIPLDTPLQVDQCVRVTFPNSTITNPKTGVPQRVIHPKKPANEKDGAYRIIKIDEERQNYWLKPVNGETITTAKRGYIKDFASEAVAA